MGRDCVTAAATASHGAVPAHFYVHDKLREEGDGTGHHHGDQQQREDEFLPLALHECNRIGYDGIGQHHTDDVDGTKPHRIPDIAPAVVFCKEQGVVLKVKGVHPPVDGSGKDLSGFFEGCDDHPEEGHDHGDAEGQNHGIADKQQNITFFHYSSSSPLFS